MNEQENTEEINKEPIETTDTTAEIGALDALSSAASENGGGDARDARIAELERELQQERVEKGRLRTANDEIRRANEEIARLKAENAKLSERRPADFLNEDERAMLDPEQLAVIDKVVKGRMGDAKAVTDAENERLRAEIAKRDERDAQFRKERFDVEVERLAPGLVRAVYDGHRDEWMKWTAERRRAPSVAAAFSSFDASTIADFLREFAESKGIQANGDGLAARPPTSTSLRGGNNPGERRGDQNVYTAEQVSSALRAAAADYEAGKITIDERRAIQKKYDAAYAEGRVVAQ